MIERDKINTGTASTEVTTRMDTYTSKVSESENILWLHFGIVVLHCARERLTCGGSAAVPSDPSNASFSKKQTNAGWPALIRDVMIECTVLGLPVKRTGSSRVVNLAQTKGEKLCLMPDGICLSVVGISMKSIHI